MAKQKKTHNQKSHQSIGAVGLVAIVLLSMVLGVTSTLAPQQLQSHLFRTNDSLHSSATLPPDLTNLKEVLHELHDDFKSSKVVPGLFEEQLFMIDSEKDQRIPLLPKRYLRAAMFSPNYEYFLIGELHNIGTMLYIYSNSQDMFLEHFIPHELLNPTFLKNDQLMYYFEDGDRGMKQRILDLKKLF